MILLISALCGYVLALLAPWMLRVGGRTAGRILALVPLAIAAGLIQTYHAAGGEPVRATFSWLPQAGVELAFSLDGLSLFFALIVTVVGSLIFLYSADYIGDRAGLFFAFMLAFMASMLGLVLADNLFALFVFFELTGLASFALIGFDHVREEARRAARQALIVTTAGGLSVFAGFLLMGQVAGTYSLSELFALGDVVRASALYPAILVLVLMAAFTKSAQFPFHFWLPNAMAAPAPVSAYLHAAAMVKAGIYLLARFYPILGGTDLWTGIVAPVGGFTMLACAWLALRHAELKRLLAYSTVAALGLMVMLLGLGGEAAIKACMVYILAHACYKAALFMVAGTVDHEAGVKEVARARGLRGMLPFTFAAAAAAGWSMAGLPLSLGFIGKELSLEAALAPGFGMATAAIALAGAAFVAVAGCVGLLPFLGSRGRESAHAVPELHDPPGLWAGPVLLGVAGFVLGLVPGLVDARLLAPAASASVGAPVEVALSLWHGLTPELGLSFLSVAIGVAVFFFWGRIRESRPARGYATAIGRVPEIGYEWALTLADLAGRTEVRTIQSGFLRRYLLTVFLATIGLLTLALWPGRAPSGVWSGIQLHDWILAILIVGASIAAVRIHSRLGALVALSVVTYSIAVIYLVYGAPDLALTQLLAETLMAVLVVLAFFTLGTLHRTSSGGVVLRDAAVAGVFGALIIMALLSAVELPFDPRLSEYFLESSYPLAHGRNVVNVILVDFRALDTLGEIFVLGAAGLGVYALIRFRRRGSGEHDGHRANGDEANDVTSTGPAGREGPA